MRKIIITNTHCPSRTRSLLPSTSPRLPPSRFSPPDGFGGPALYGHGAVFSRGLRASHPRLQPVRPHGLGGDGALLVRRDDPPRHQRLPLHVSLLRDPAERAHAVRPPDFPGQSGLTAGEGSPGRDRGSGRTAPGRGLMGWSGVCDGRRVELRGTCAEFSCQSERRGTGGLLVYVTVT